MNETIEQLLANNAAWAQGVIDRDPTFFEKSALGQSPAFLWIGCSDSRVTAEQIVGAAPGEVFVHRNIANVVVHTDLNCNCVLQFAIDALKVKHVIVCGHHGCGGVRACLDHARHGLVDVWLRHIQDVAYENEKELGAIADESARADRLSELNVLRSRQNVARTATVQDAWDRGQPLSLHAWVYRSRDGRIHQLAPPMRQHRGAR